MRKLLVTAEWAQETPPTFQHCVGREVEGLKAGKACTCELFPRETKDLKIG
jgi:hypothetical protein